MRALNISRQKYPSRLPAELWLKPALLSSSVDLSWPRPTVTCPETSLDHIVCPLFSSGMDHEVCLRKPWNSALPEEKNVMILWIDMVRLCHDDEDHDDAHGSPYSVCVNVLGSGSPSGTNLVSQKYSMQSMDVFRHAVLSVLGLLSILI